MGAKCCRKRKKGEKDDHVSAVVEINKVDTLEQLINNSHNLVVVDFFADWCGPCRKLAPTIHNLSREHKDVKFCKVNVDKQPALESKYKVSALPTVLFFKDGEKVHHVVGCNEMAVIQSVAAFKSYSSPTKRANSVESPPPPESRSNTSLNPEKHTHSVRENKPAEISDETQLASIIEDAKNLVLVHFFDEMDPNSRKIGHFLHYLSSEYEDVSIYSMNVGGQDEIQARNSISLLPTISFYRNKDRVLQIQGYNKTSIQNAVHALKESPNKESVFLPSKHNNFSDVNLNQ